MNPARLQRRLDSLDVRRIAVIKPTALGDVVQSLPVLPVLAERFPDARITWVISRPLAPLVAGHPDLGEWIGYDRRGGWRSWRELTAALRGGRFDLVFDLQGLLRTALMTRATGARLRIGLETAREASGLACHGLLEDSGRFVPAHRRYWRVAEFLGLGNRRPETTISIPPADRGWADMTLERLGGHVLAIHAGARWQTKRWPPEHFATVAAHAVREHGVAIVLVGSGDEQPVATRLKQLVLRQAPAARVQNLAGQTSLAQLAAVLSSVAGLVSNDSGPMHLAAAFDTPVVGLFTCTDSVRSGPPPGRHVLIDTSLECGGSYHRSCPFRGSRHLSCMDNLAPTLVCSGLDRLLDTRRDAAAPRRVRVA